MNNYIKLFNQLSKKWIFPCRLFIPNEFFFTISNERYFYIDFIDSYLTFNKITFSSYLEMRLTKQDNNIVASSILHSRAPSSQNVDTLTLTNGKYLSNGDYIKNFTHATIICDYKDIPRILSHYMAPKQPYIQSSMATLTNEILRSLKPSIRCHQMACSKRMSMAPILYQINRQ